MKNPLSQTLEELKTCLDEIRTKREWYLLFRDEDMRKGPYSPRFSEPSLAELKTEIGRFFVLHVKMINRIYRAPSGVRKQWKQQVQKLQAEVNALSAPQPL